MIRIAAFTGIISFLATYYLVPIFCTIAYKLNVLDIPNTLIKNHKKPTPYLGGVAIFIGFILALSCTFPFHNDLFVFFTGITLLLFVGLIDDLVVLKPYQKLSGQLIAALCFLRGGIYLKEQFFLKSIVVLPLSLLWILSISNAFNLIDVMDGLATTTALGISAALLVVAFSLNNSEVCLLLVAFMGALLAFLFYNKPTARIYLGDAGSLFIGGFLSVIPFLLSWSEYTYLGSIVPLAIFFVPLLELGMLIVIRTYKHIPFYKGSADHFAHYLQRKKWTPSKILVLTACFNVLLSALSILFLFNILGLLPFLVVSFGVAISWIILIYKP